MALDRKAAKARCELATPGPWHVDTRTHDERPTTEEVCDLVNDMWVTTDHHLNNYRDDAAFIARARTDLPAAPLYVRGCGGWCWVNLTRK